MAYEYLLIDRDEGIAVITINRPDKYNALNEEVVAEISSAMDELAADDEVRVVIFIGAGEKAFVSGADIGVLQEFATSKAGFAHSQRGQAVMNKVENLPKPVIAAVNGYALGGGLELAMACDVRLASENARMGQTEVVIGVGMGYGGSQRLPRLVGKGMAKLMVLTGQMIDAQEALRIGLVQKVVPQAELLSEAKALAKQMAANAPGSLAAAKEAVNMGLEVDLRTGLYIESLKFGSLCPTEDYREGTTAFMEKRKPVYKGR
jgi:enoyl-CoA hydratase